MGRSERRWEIEEQKERWDETSHTSRKGNRGKVEGEVLYSYPKSCRRAGNTYIHTYTNRHTLDCHTTAKHALRAVYIAVGSRRIFPE